MTSRRKLQWGLVLLALVNMVPAIEADSSWRIWLFVAGAALLSRLLALPDGTSRLPKSVQMLGVFGAVAFLLYEMFGQHEGPTVYVLDLAHFMMLLCACKFFEMKSDRDMGLVTVIAFLVLVIGGFVSGSLVFGAAAVVDMTAGIYWLMTFQNHRAAASIELRRAAHFRAAAVYPSAGLYAAEARQAPRFGRAALLSALGLTGTATVIFVMVPRGFGRNLFGGIERVVPSAITGFAEEVKLSGTQLLESQAAVMKVKYFKNGRPIEDGDYQPYMRAWSLDSYSGEQWTRRPVSSSFLRSPIPNTRERTWLAPADESWESETDWIEQQVWVDQAEAPCLFALQPPLGISVEKPTRVQMDQRDSALIVAQAPGGALNYRVWSPARITPRMVSRMRGGRRFFPPADQVPAKIGELSRQIKARVGGEQSGDWEDRVAKAICEYLSKGDFQYSLTRQRTPRGVDAVEDFVFNQKRGHCEFFASAMTLMAQAAGLRARFVTGYFGGEFNTAGGFYQFRQKDAHAWVEVLLPERGWVTFDPSPPSESRRRGPDQGLLARARRMMDFLQFEWSTFVVAFDSDVRKELMGRFKTMLAGGEEAGLSRGARMHPVLAFFWGPDVLTIKQRIFYWLLLVLCAALGILLLRVVYILSLMVREYLPRRKRGGASVQRRPHARFYDRLLLLLAAKGHAKPADLTPREYARVLGRACPDLVEVGEITDWFYQAQYGDAAPDAERQTRIREFLVRLREDAAFGVRRSQRPA